MPPLVVITASHENLPTDPIGHSFLCCTKCLFTCLCQKLIQISKVQSWHALRWHKDGQNCICDNGDFVQGCDLDVTSDPFSGTYLFSNFGKYNSIFAIKSLWDFSCKPSEVSCQKCVLQFPSSLLMVDLECDHEFTENYQLWGAVIF